jgi:hypothetical protein
MPDGYAGMLVIKEVRAMCVLLSGAVYQRHEAHSTTNNMSVLSSRLISARRVRLCRMREMVQSMMEEV